jgi:hypothetical protein
MCYKNEWLLVAPLLLAKCQNFNTVNLSTNRRERGGKVGRYRVSNRERERGVERERESRREGEGEGESEREGWGERGS